MTNYQTEQQAAELWRTIDAKIDKKIDTLLKQQTGITPGVEYGSAIYNTFGQAVWGGAGAGGSSPQYGNGSISAGTSYAASSYTLISYSVTGFTSGQYTAPVTGKYAYSLYFRAASASWTAGDYIRIYEDINGTAFIVDYFTVQATGTMFAQAHPHNIVSLAAGDKLSWFIYQTRSGGAITVDLTFVNILGFA